MKKLNLFEKSLIEKNKKEYGSDYGKLKFLSYEEIKATSNERAELLEKLSDFAVSGFNNTKIDLQNLSRGCQLCGEGNWSCLFINGKCNCSCFYCPTSQDNEDNPTTNTIPFLKTEDYLNYIEKFNFKGVSISGGEPLLTSERTFEFFNAVNNKFGNRVYKWMYTNGTLLNEDILLRLKDAGLNEIRIDIGAIGYSLEKVKQAKKIIDVVTVEIPAVPEEFNLLKDKIKEMKDLGVNHLNLHQMRLTPYNFRHLIKRDYTYIHGERITVVDSELTALKLMLYNFENDICLPINYCSFKYKSQFQRAAARRRNADGILKNYEVLSRNGFIRTIKIMGKEKQILNLAGLFEKRGFFEFHYSNGDNFIFVNENMLKYIDFESEQLSMDLIYSEAVLLPNLSYQNPFTKVELNCNKNIVIEKVRRYHKVFEPEKVSNVARYLSTFEKLYPDPEMDFIKYYELPQIGFQKYI